MFSPAGQKRRLSLQVDFVLRTGKWETCKANETSKGEYLVGMVRDTNNNSLCATGRKSDICEQISIHILTVNWLFFLFFFLSILFISLSLLFFSSFLVFLVSFQSSSQSVDFAH